MELGFQVIWIQTKGVVLTGYLSGTPLAELYSNCGLFVLPSYYEGLSIALLEALSYELPVLVSDIPQHTEIQLRPTDYFRAGHVPSLARGLVSSFAQGVSPQERARRRELLRNDHDWDRIAEQTMTVYRSILS